jgi:hypothetical protein
LRINKIGDAGATWLAMGLRHSVSLASLALGTNTIKDAGAIELAEAAAASPSLSFLDLDANGIEDNGAHAISQVPAGRARHGMARVCLPRLRIEQMRRGRRRFPLVASRRWRRAACSRTSTWRTTSSATAAWRTSLLQACALFLTFACPGLRPRHARPHARPHARRCMHLGAIASAHTEWQRLARRQPLAAARARNRHEPLCCAGCVQ